MTTIYSRNPKDQQSIENYQRYRTLIIEEEDKDTLKEYLAYMMLDGSQNGPQLYLLAKLARDRMDQLIEKYGKSN